MRDDVQAVSALTGEGMDALLALIEERIAGALVTRQFTVPAARFADVAWLYENAVVRDRQDGDDGSVSVSVQMTRDTADAYDRRTARVTEKTG